MPWTLGGEFPLIALKIPGHPNIEKPNLKKKQFKKNPIFSENQ